MVKELQNPTLAKASASSWLHSKCVRVMDCNTSKYGNALSQSQGTHFSASPSRVQGFCVSPHFLQEDLLLQVYDSSCIWAMRKCSCLHLHCEVFRCCRDLAQQLEPTTLSCGVRADVDELVLLPWPAGPKTIPFHQCTIHGFAYGVGLWTRSLIRTSLTTLLAASKTVIISFSSSASCPSLCWGQGFNSQGHRHFMRVHDVHVRHGQAKAGLLCFTLTKILEQWDIIEETPISQPDKAATYSAVWCTTCSNLSSSQFEWPYEGDRQRLIFSLIGHPTGL